MSVTIRLMLSYRIYNLVLDVAACFGSCRQHDGWQWHDARRGGYAGLTRQGAPDHARLVATAREDAMQRSDRHHALRLSA